MTVPYVFGKGCEANLLFGLSLLPFGLLAPLFRLYVEGLVIR